MTKNNQSNRLDSIDFVQDISSQTAAVYSGGAVTLYKDRGLNGPTVTRSISVRNIGFDENGGSTNFNDKASSIEITSGRWRFYEDINYRGRRLRTLGPGRYNIGPNFNDKISSVRRVG